MDANHIDLSSHLLNKWQNLLHSHARRLAYYFVHITFFFARRMYIFLSYLSSVKLELPNSKILTAKSVINDGKNLKKIPKHLALIFGDNTDSSFIVNALVWAFLIEVPCITIYNKSGSLENKKSIIESKYKEKCKLFSLDAKPILLNTAFHKGSFNENEKSRYIVVVTSFKSMQNQFLEVAKHLCTEMAKENHKINDLDKKLVDRSLREHCPCLVDPDLAICFNDYYTFAGYQPWSTRLTEILHLKSTTNLSYPKFLEALQKFARCQQRLGA